MPREERATQHALLKENNDKHRKLKSEYRHLTETLRNDGEDLADYTKSTLQDRVRTLNELANAVERPSEQADDSEAFFTLTQRGAEMAKRVTAGKGRSAKDFVRHLKAAYVHSIEAQQGGALDPTAFMWGQLCGHVRRMFKYAPGVSCLLGPLDAAPKVRKVAQRVQRKPVGEVVAPEVLKANEQQESRETERNLDQMWAVLKGAPPEGLGLLDLILNHDSFAQTAENLFTLSFLVHTKRARISPEEERGLVVHPHKATKDNSQQQQQDKERMQFIIGYTMADWAEWKRYVPRSACLTEARPDTTEAAGPSRTAPPAQQGDADEQPARGASRKASKGRSQAAASQARPEEGNDAEQEEEEEDDEDAPPRKRRGKQH